MLENSQKTDGQNREFGFQRFTIGTTTGWLFNMQATSIIDEDTNEELSAVDFYFIREDGTKFSCYLPYQPYFYLVVDKDFLSEVEAMLVRKFESTIASIQVVEREDLDLQNHLCGNKGIFLKLSFLNIDLLNRVRNDLRPRIARNKKREAQAYAKDLIATPDHAQKGLHSLSKIYDMREFDVQYLHRVCIDNRIHAGLWYDVDILEGTTVFRQRTDIIEPPEVTILAYDIETTKSPLKFPNSEKDAVMMISYMVNGKGYLIVNREVVSEDIDDFEYTPKPEFVGKFKVFNEPDEFALLRRFFVHIRELQPNIIVTYNGDFFDFPFVDDRALMYNLDLKEQIGIFKSREEYLGRFCIHLDAFCWVKRDSYLPQGSQGLKAVTKAKLNYEPLELDPEDMLPFATENPQLLASYSVSDAVATYYLYMTYVHSFIFSLATIIPMTPEEVLRKGSGTLCEQLLMVRAFEKNIMAPNKQSQKFPQFHDNLLIDSETYIGGHVECLESGIFREDFKYEFDVDPDTLMELQKDIENLLRFVIEKEWKQELEEVTNFNEIRDAIRENLQTLINAPKFLSEPLIYHLDVGAMYPNIILTNRLQPMSIVDKSVCASCNFNNKGEECQRSMDWVWRVKHYPVTRSDFRGIKERAEAQGLIGNGDDYETDHNSLIKKVKEYSQLVYRKVFVERVENRQNTVCQRENPFYVDTVRNFRDRRYLYKKLKKDWSIKSEQAKSLLELQKAKSMEQLYDSQQLAHKCILNSFYGYVMRRGARWYSMEMAGIVTKTGASIIKDARMLIERIGRPLELDTDGIWCMLPKMFPENFVLKTETKSFKFSYSCALLNLILERNYSNDQYLTLENPETLTYSKRRENTIFFEVDGPYKAMILPAAQEEGKTLKKRYIVFERDGSIAELKGFEIKRRGELKLIKQFQSQLFPCFLDGSNLQECYQSVAVIADHYLDILQSEGDDLEDDELFELFSESKIMSQSLAEYGKSRSCAITAAKRMADFLGAEMVKDKGLCCRFIVSKWPQGVSVSDRAIPIEIFSAEEDVQNKFLTKWLKVSLNPEDFDVRAILDWQYYGKRISSAIQKIITIPAAFQKLENPVPRVHHPDWLLRKIAEEFGAFKQQKLTKYFKPAEKVDIPYTEEEHSNEHSEGNMEIIPEGPSDWLSVQKQVWKSIRQKRKLSSMTSQSRPSQRHPWHILHISVTNGYAKLWYVTQALRMGTSQFKTTDPEFTLLLKLGSVVSPTKDQSEPSALQSPYMQDISISKHFIFFASAPGHSRGLVALFLQRPHEWELTVVVINASNAKLDRPNIQSMYSDISQKDHRSLKLQWEQKRSMQEAFTVIDGRLRREGVLHGEEPAVVLVQSPLDKVSVESYLTSAPRYFALSYIPWSTKDNLPPLDWLRSSSKTMFHRLSQSTQWYDDTLAASRYANVPFCNIPSDLPSYLCDILYGRLVGEPEFHESSLQFPQEPLSNPCIDFPGVFRLPCIEISVHNLAPNAVLLFNIVQSLEGGVFEEPQGFRSLRLMIHQLISDAVLMEDSSAELLLKHFQRWLSQSSGRYFDAELRHFVHLSMHKVFLRLCGAVKQIGAELIHASFDKLIICPRKANIDNAILFTKSMAESILEQELFSHLSFGYERVWECLVFVDNYNFIGLEHDEQSQLVGNWNVVSFLPQPVQHCFHDILYEFLIQPKNVLDKLIGSRNDADQAIEEVNQFSINLVETNLTRSLLEIVDQIQYSAREQDLSFPNPPGSYLNLHNPALEFVKSICHVMKLEKCSYDAVQTMRGNLLRLLNVKSFSPEAQFVNPCLSIVLPDVICSFCNHCRDLDLCRDQDLLEGKWECSFCEHQYDKDAIEFQLLNRVLQHVAVYQAQDLKCCNCKRVASYDLQSYCQCSGKFHNSTEKDSIEQKMKVVSQVADFHSMEWLQQVSDALWQ